MKYQLQGHDHPVREMLQIAPVKLTRACSRVLATYLQSLQQPLLHQRISASAVAVKAGVATVAASRLSVDMSCTVQFLVGDVSLAELTKSMRIGATPGATAGTCRLLLPLWHYIS